MSIQLDLCPHDELLMINNEAEKNANKARAEAKRLMDIYHRQSLHSSYVTEDQIIEQLFACKRARNDFRTVSDMIRRDGDYGLKESFFRDSLSHEVDRYVKMKQNENEEE